MQGDGLSIEGVHGTVLAQWSRIVQWCKTKHALLLTTNNDGRYAIPVAQVPPAMLSTILEVLKISGIPERKASGRGATGSWNQIATGEKVVRGIVFGIGGLIVALAILIFVADALFPV